MTKKKIIISALLFMAAPFYEACVIKVMANGNEFGDLVSSVENTYVDYSDSYLHSENSSTTTLPPRKNTSGAKPKATPKKETKRPKPKRRYRRVVTKNPPRKRNRPPNKRTIKRKRKKVKKCPTRNRRSRINCKYKPRR